MLDLPHVIELGKKHIESQGLRKRCELVPGDFFKNVPDGGDAYILKAVLHDWDDDRSIAILKNCHKAMAPDAKVCIIESVIPADNRPFLRTLGDLNMLIMTGGRTDRGNIEFARCSGISIQSDCHHFRFHSNPQCWKLCRPDWRMGTLFLVATPIGNLADISLRALEILNHVDLIACEDTRHTIKLLNHFGIKKPLQSYHEFNEEKAQELTDKLSGGMTIAVVSDAGMPGSPILATASSAYADHAEFRFLPFPVRMRLSRRWRLRGCRPTSLFSLGFCLRRRVRVRRN